MKGTDVNPAALADHISKSCMPEIEDLNDVIDRLYHRMAKAGMPKPIIKDGMHALTQIVIEDKCREALK